MEVEDLWRNSGGVDMIRNGCRGESNYSYLIEYEVDEEDGPVCRIFATHAENEGEDHLIMGSYSPDKLDDALSDLRVYLINARCEFFGRLIDSRDDVICEKCAHSYEQRIEEIVD